MPRPPAGLQKAREYLDSRIARKAGPMSVHALGLLAGVSYKTMWKAVRALKADGRLHGNYRVSGGSPKARPSLPDTFASSLDRLEQRLTRDVLDGAIVRDGNVHSVKELQARYGTSSETLRKVLHKVGEEGLIAPRGRHWCIQPAPAKKPAAIVLLAYMQYPDDFALPPLEREFLRTCEMTCLSAQVSLTIVALRHDAGALRLSDMHGNRLAALPGGRDIAGYLYMLQSAEAFDASIMKALIALRKPVAVLDGARVFPREEKAWDLQRVRIFVPTAHQRAGKDVARYILSRGHRHAAYISPFHGDAWSRVRYAGTQSVFEKAGDGVSLSLFSAAGSIKEQGPYIKQGMADSGGTRISRLVREWSAKMPAYFPWKTSKVTETLASYFLFQGIGAAMRRLFDQAMADPRISAWIIASDHAAHAALPYCKEKGIAIPGRIAVIGFDDAIESSELDLTSYNFNFPAAAATIVHFILHPDAGFWQHRRIVETGGRIVQRATT